MLKDQRGCDEHVLRRYDRELPNGAAGHFTTFRTFDVAMMIDCTPLSDATNVYHSGAQHEGVSVWFSRHQESGIRHSYFVTLDGGKKAIKDGILTRFQEQLNLPVANFQHVSSQGSDTYVWVVEMV